MMRSGPRCALTATSSTIVCVLALAVCTRSLAIACLLTLMVAIAHGITTDNVVMPNSMLTSTTVQSSQGVDESTWSAVAVAMPEVRPICIASTIRASLGDALLIAAVSTSSNGALSARPSAYS